MAHAGRHVDGPERVTPQGYLNVVVRAECHFALSVKCDRSFPRVRFHRPVELKRFDAADPDRRDQAPGTATRAAT